MEIRKSTKKDISDIMQIYSQARKFMEETGNPNQWGTKYPEEALIEEDIRKGNSYVCVEGNEVVGVFMYTKESEPTYEKIYEGRWKNEELYGVVHRIASLKGRKGVATFCLNWCLEDSGNIRIDTHRDNVPMLSLLDKSGFERCGIIYLKNGDERIAFQKIKKLS